MEGEVLTTWQKLNKIIGMLDNMTESLTKIEEKFDGIESTQKEMKEMITAFSGKIQLSHSSVDIEFIEE